MPSGCNLIDRQLSGGHRRAYRKAIERKGRAIFMKELSFPEERHRHIVAFSRSSDLCTCTQPFFPSGRLSSSELLLRQGIFPVG